MTSLELRSQIKSQIWPSGVAENLDTPVVAGQKSPMDMIFDEAMADIAKWIPCEQQNNVDVIAFADTNFKCAVTILPKARASIVRRVGTVEGIDYCAAIWYRQVETLEPEAEGRRFASLVPSDSPVLLPLGFRTADESTDWPNGRAMSGIWSINKASLNLFPWIQSTESVIVEWDGIKTGWADADLVNPAQDYRKAVKFYAQYAYERDYGSMQQAAAFKTLYDAALAELGHQCREETKVRDSFIIPPTEEQVAARIIPPTPDDMSKQYSGTFAIGNNAAGGIVTGLSLSFTPRVVLLTVSAPTNGLMLMASSVTGTLTADGFDFNLSGITDSANYVLNYEIS